MAKYLAAVLVKNHDNFGAGNYMVRSDRPLDADAHTVNRKLGRLFCDVPLFVQKG